MPEADGGAPAGKRRSSKAMEWGIRGILGAGVLAYLVGGSRWSEIARALRSLDARVWLAGVLLYLLGQAVCAWKWGFLARAMGMERPYRSLLAYYFGGMFFNLFLPSTVGGDLARATALSRPDGTLGRAAISVLADRGAGFGALLLIAAGAAVLFPAAPEGLRWALLFGVALLALGGVAALAVPDRFRRLGKTLHGALLACREPATLGPVLLLAVVFQGMIVFIHYLLGRALGLSLPLGLCMLVSTIPAVVAMLPISVNGVGTRDAAYVALLALGQIPRETAVAFALSWFALVVACSAIGGLVLALLAPGQMALLLGREKPGAAGRADGGGE